MTYSHIQIWFDSEKRILTRRILTQAWEPASFCHPGDGDSVAASPAEHAGGNRRRRYGGGPRGSLALAPATVVGERGDALVCLSGVRARGSVRLPDMRPDTLYASLQVS